MTVIDKCQEALSTAQQIYDMKPNWVVFFREILGQRGVVRRLYPTHDALVEFEKMPEYAEIQSMLTKLRTLGEGQDTQEEPCKVITVRLPKSMHESLKEEAHGLKTSMNALCISKLLQIVDGDLIPGEKKDSQI